ncbi:cilia- and flagella-associated protein 58 [Aplysia californica]|uniref:Cilia- and flagella-associated protein 58 n=1 Tax=Aplysia californica TaxID=6500 RepID=A0ABM0JGW3_APLCA|nr:cilia- and flagella-associated protein 58 [Aplysia californica]
MSDKRTSESGTTNNADLGRLGAVADGATHEEQLASAAVSLSGRGTPKNVEFKSKDTSDTSIRELTFEDAELPNELKTMEDIQNTFSAVIEEFRGDKSAERFLEEYEKLYEALKSSHKELKTWQLRCSSLASEIKNNTEKVNLAIHLSQEDRGMIATLNRQVQDAWGMVDILHDREMKAKDAVSSMKEEINTLTQLVEEGMGLEELQRLSEKAAAERKAMEEIIADLKEDKDGQEMRNNEVLSRMKEKDQKQENEINDLKTQKSRLKLQSEEDKTRLEEAQQYTFRLERAKFRLEGDKAKLEADVAGWKKRLKKAEEMATDFKFESSKYLSQFRKEKELAASKTQELISSEQKYLKLTMKNKELLDQLGEMTLNMQERERELMAKTKELQDKDFRLMSFVKKNEMLSEKLSKTQHNLTECDENRKTEKNEIRTLEANIAASEKHLEIVTKQLKKAASQIESSEKVNTKLLKQKEKIDSSLKIESDMNRSLLSDLATAQENTKNIYENLQSLTFEKDKLFGRINQQSCEIARLNDELHTKEIVAFMAQQHRAEVEHQLKQMKENLVYALSQRDNINSMLRKTELLNSDLSQANVNIGKQTKSLSEDILNKEQQLSHLSDKYTKLKDELNEAHNELVIERVEGKKRKDQVRDMYKELRYVEKMMERQRGQIERQNIYIEELTCQRNILGAQCVRNKQEISMLKQKHDILGDIMQMGDRLYNERIREIGFLHLQNANLWRQKDGVMHKLENIDNLKSKLGLANQQLVNFKARCKALEDQAPMPVHKWRHLKAQDFSKFEMILKTNHLVKKLIAKTEEVTRLEGALLDKAQVLKYFKGMLEKAPGPDVAMRACLDRREKEGMTKKLKAALAEMNMVEWKAQAKGQERDELKKQLVEEKKKRMQQQKTFEKERKKFLPPIAPVADSNSFRGKLVLNHEQLSSDNKKLARLL